MRIQSRGQGQDGHGVAAQPSRWRRRAALSAGALAALALGAGPASAGEREDPPRPDDDAVVSVYREVLPRASGPKADDGGGGERRPLPAAVETQIERVGGA